MAINLKIMAQILYDTYKYQDQAEMNQSITDSGYQIPDPFTQSGTLVALEGEDNDPLGYTYMGQVVTNYPQEGEEWVAEYSEEVYIHSARRGNSKLPSDKMVIGNERKYFNEYINRYFGEPEE